MLVYLERLDLKGFRSLADTAVTLQPGVTVLVGENNAGKSNIMDAIRHLTPPLDGRRDLYLRTEDLHRDGCTNGGHQDGCRTTVELSARYAADAPGELPLLDQALNGKADGLSHHLSYEPPRWGRQRGQVTWRTGDTLTSDPDPEPMAREGFRHLYLPPLRDAQRELASGNSGLIQYLVESQFADEEESRVFQEGVRAKFRDMEAIPPLPRSLDSLQTRLDGLTQGARHQEAGIGFADVSLRSVIRSLRLRMEQRGVQALASSGLGYANLLFMAAVLAQLDKAAEADLTLLLVEEPEAHLHPQLQGILMEHLAEEARLSRERGSRGGRWLGHVQVVVTTHSPHIATAVSPEQLVIVQRHGEATVRTSSTAQVSSKTDGVGAETTHVPLNRTQEETTHTRTSSDGPSLHEPDRLEPGRRYFTDTAAVANMPLSTHDTYKIRQYLNATRNTMLFGPRVLLVEGIAEAILLPTLAESFLEGAAHQRFLGTALVPIDGTHFATYLNVLLTPDRVTGRRIARRVAVITDGDSGSTRPAQLRELIEAKEAKGCAEVFTNVTTLEPTLLQAGGNNRALFEQAWALQRGEKTDQDWREIDAHEGPGQAAFLMSRFKNLKVSKGTFMQDLVACSASRKQALNAPTYLGEALEWITSEDHDDR